MERIELRQERDFSEKFNATFNFIKNNFKNYLWIMLVLIAPLAVVQSVFLNYFQGYITGFMGDSTFQSGGLDMGEFAGNLISMYLILLLVFAVFYTWMQTVVMAYLKLYLDGTNPITVGAVAGLAAKKFFRILGLVVLIGIITILGFMLCIIPGIYISISLIMVPLIVFFEGDPAFEAFGRSFKLIKNNWWSTLGLMIVTSFIVGIMAFIFAIPQYVVTMFSVFNGEMPYNSVSYTIAGAVTGLGTGLLYPVIYIALAFQYFNLVEKKESTGLKQLIDQAPNLPKIDNVNQGEY